MISSWAFAGQLGGSKTRHMAELYVLTASSLLLVGKMA